MKLFCLFAVILFSQFLFAVDEEKIQPSGLVNGDGFGGATCLKGDVLIVGAPFKDISGNDSVGSFQYFKRIAGSWVFQSEIESPDGTSNDFFGATLDFNGTHLIVGAPKNDEGGIDAGAAYVYEYNGSNFTFVKKLLASSGAAGDEYGRSVAIDDTTIVVGVPKDDALAPNTGAVYVYHLDNNNWAELQKVTSNFVEFGNEFFGYSVAIHKDRFIVGATLDDDAATDAGTAFVYAFNGATWVFEQKLSPSDGASSHSFGFSTAINDSILIVGAFGANNSVSSSGAAYIFRRSGTTWTEEEILFQADVNIDDWFGFDVDIEGNTAIVTALNNDEFVSNGGSNYLIRYDAVLNEWIHEYNQCSTDALLNWRYGYSCSLDGLNYVIGALQATGTTVKSGAAYYYEICTHKTDQSLCAVSSDSSSTGNYVLWEGIKTTLVDSFYIFRSIAGMNNYSKIGATQYYAINEFYDPIDVNQTAYSYKISTLNICGVESDSSSAHTTIHLNSDDATGNVVLNWTPASGYNFDFYRVFRDPQNDGTYDLLFAVLNSATTFTDFSPTGNAITNYRVMALNTSPCSSLSRPSFSSTYSNASNPFLAGINENSQIEIFLYPNPANDFINIEGNIPSNTQLTVFDSNGKKIWDELIGDGKVSISNWEAGIYMVQFKINGIYKSMRFIKN
ncbi:MAG: T9SS type A sorting domain-containing protein [Crocinitomicaceae bacterium]|nr:T9SS type A sorting domain-containing protein [Crocinitomicaceae bacterium]